MFNRRGPSFASLPTGSLLRNMITLKQRPQFYNTAKHFELLNMFNMKFINSYLISFQQIDIELILPHCDHKQNHNSKHLLIDEINTIQA